MDYDCFRLGDEVIWYDSRNKIQRTGIIRNFTPHRVVIEVKLHFTESIDKAINTGIPLGTLFQPAQKLTRIARVKAKNLSRV